MEGNAKVIAVTGKGGVGKTSLAAGMVRRLTQRYPDAKILAIDADPAVGSRLRWMPRLRRRWMISGWRLRKESRKS